MSISELIAIVLLTLVLITATIGGFLINPAAGFYSFAVVGFILGLMFAYSRNETGR
jgi:hypothetical protein